MRKVAVGLLAAAGIALAVPAHAQGFWFGVGPVGVGFGTGPYAYDYGPYWGGSYGYAPDYAYGYGYTPGYTYAPAYDVDYGYGPPYEYSYPPDYAYGTIYAAPGYVSSTYPYGPRYRYGRSFVRVRTSHPVPSRHLEYRSARISGEAYRAQASAPARHVNGYSRSVTIQR
jgi:hypothetical protein